MSEPKSTLQIPSWMGGAIITLLTLQLGLLWLQGTLLHRQHGDLVGLREDIQYLAENMDPGGDSDTEEGPRPARTRLRRNPAHLRRAAFIQNDDPEAEGEKSARKDLEEVRKSQQDAVAKARDTQEKMSISENIRKAEEKGKLDAEGQRWRPWMWAAGALAIAAMFLRSWLRRRG